MKTLDKDRINYQKNGSELILKPQKNKQYRTQLIFGLFYLFIAVIVIYYSREWWSYLIFILLLLLILITILLSLRNISIQMDKNCISYIIGGKVKKSFLWKDIKKIETGFTSNINAYPTTIGGVMLSFSNYYILLTNKAGKKIIFGEGMDNLSMQKAFNQIITHLKKYSVEVDDKIDFGKIYGDNEISDFIKTHKRVLKRFHPLGSEVIWRKNSAKGIILFVINWIISVIIILLIISYFILNQNLYSIIEESICIISIIIVLAVIVTYIDKPNLVGFNKDILIIKQNLIEYKFPWNTIKSISDISAAKGQVFTGVKIYTKDGKDRGFGSIQHEIIYEMQARFEEYLDIYEKNDMVEWDSDDSEKERQTEHKYEVKKSSTLNSLTDMQNLYFGAISELEKDIRGKSSFKCRYCGSELNYLRKSNKWYCPGCKDYFDS
jgi:hypothetical protein